MPAAEFAQIGMFLINALHVFICFHCGFSIRGWTSKLSPSFVHATFSPLCPFLMLTRGRQFIKKVVLSGNEWVPPTEPRIILLDERQHAVNDVVDLYGTFWKLINQDMRTVLQDNKQATIKALGRREMRRISPHGTRISRISSYLCISSVTAEPNPPSVELHPGRSTLTYCSRI